MKIKACLCVMVATALFAFTHSSVSAQSKKTIILVRHAEKAASTEMDKTGDVDLSAEGRERAERLAKAVRKYRPREIFATDYKRTQQTAEPIARLRGVKMQIYDTAKQADFAAKILAGKTSRYLIVGHSNSTPEMANLFMKKEVFKQLPDAEYGVFWVIRIKRGVVTKIEIFPY